MTYSVYTLANGKAETRAEDLSYPSDWTVKSPLAFAQTRLAQLANEAVLAQALAL